MGNLKIITFKLEDDVVIKLDELAIQLNITRSEVIRRAVKHYLQKYNNVLVKPKIQVVEKVVVK